MCDLNSKIESNIAAEIPYKHRAYTYIHARTRT